MPLQGILKASQHLLLSSAVYCCCCLANVSLPGLGGTVPESKPFFYVNVADIEMLKTEVSYVACKYDGLGRPFFFNFRLQNISRYQAVDSNCWEIRRARINYLQKQERAVGLQGKQYAVLKNPVWFWQVPQKRSLRRKGISMMSM